MTLDRVLELVRLDAEMKGYDLPSLVDLVVRPAWHDDALCREYPDVSWFPARGTSTGPAKDVCGRCLVRAECLDAALESDEPPQGVWGGTAPEERRRLRVGRAEAA